MIRALACLMCVLTAASAARDGGPRAQPTREEKPLAAGLDDLAPARDLPFFYDLYTFRGDARATAVVASFAVPVGNLGREWDRGRVRYRFDVTLVVSDTAIGSVSRTDDSVYVSVHRPLDGGHLLHTHVEVEAPPSASTLQRVVMTDAESPGIGQLYTSPFPIPDYTGRELMLSDIALGLPGATQGWERGDVTLALLPTSQFPRGSFDVYYEIYNLPAGNDYSTEIAIQRLDDPDAEEPGGGRTVGTRYAGESSARADGALPELRHIQASLADGRYRLTVTVTDESTGRTARRSRLLEVHAWKRGATMVPALPASRIATASRGAGR